jgi:hypothetical protein
VTPAVVGPFSEPLSGVSTAVVPSSTLCRRFWPVSLTTRSRLAAGLKSTPNVVPSSATLSWETFLTVTSVAGGVGIEIV